MSFYPYVAQEFLKYNEKVWIPISPYDIIYFNESDILYRHDSYWVSLQSFQQMYGFEPQSFSSFRQHQQQNQQQHQQQFPRFPQQFPFPLPQPPQQFPRFPLPIPFPIPQPSPPQQQIPFPLPIPLPPLPQPQPPQPQPQPPQQLPIPLPLPLPVPIPQPPQQGETVKEGGSIVNTWSQDPTVQIVGRGILSRPILLPKGLPINLIDEDFAFDGPLPGTILLDQNNNCLLNYNEQRELFNAISCFATLKNLKAMWERIFSQKLIWRWNNPNIPGSKAGNIPIKIIFDKKKKEPNAFYAPNKRAFIFHEFNDEKGNIVRTEEMIEVVLHEGTHGLLDARKPGWIMSVGFEASALHEAMGDIGSLLYQIDDPSVCTDIINATKGNLNSNNFFSKLAEQFGTSVLQKSDGLRNANDDVKRSQASNNAHDLSRVLVGIVYDIISDFYELTKKRRLQTKQKTSKGQLLDLDYSELSRTLWLAGEYCKSLIAATVASCPENEPTFRHFIDGMIAAEKDDERKKIIIQNATRKEVQISTIISKLTSLVAPTSVSLNGNNQNNQELLSSSSSSQSLSSALPPSLPLADANLGVVPVKFLKSDSQGCIRFEMVSA